MSKKLTKGGAGGIFDDRDTGVLVFMAFIFGTAIVVSASAMYSSRNR